MRTRISNWLNKVSRIIDGPVLMAKQARKRTSSPVVGGFAAEVQQLEQRALMTATIAVADVAVIEGDASVKPIDAFVNNGLSNTRNITFSPDGQDFYVASQNTDQVLRYSASDGHLIGVAMSGSDGMSGPWAMTFGPDGLLYVGGKASQNIMSYDPASGQVSTFVAAGSGIDIPKGMTFGSDGNLYVTTTGLIGETVPDQVLRFWGPGVTTPGVSDPGAGKTGAVFIDDITPNGTDAAWDNPNGITFGPDGRLYVTETHDQKINRYEADGTFKDTFVAAGSGGLNGPTSLLFRSDGLLYVTSQNNNSVLRYNATTGAFVDSYIPSGSGDVLLPNDLKFDPSGNLYVSSTNSGQVLRYGSGSQAAFIVTLNSASTTPVTVNFATANGLALAGIDYVAMSGTLTFSPGETSKTILVRTLSDGVSAGDKSFVVNLSSASGATISDAQAVGTIRDGQTKFHVVNAGVTGGLYNYGSTGASVGTSTLTAGDNTPLGAASNASGTTTWVVDSNKKVYVYDANGNILGSWSPGTIKNTAVLDGLATNGTDIWLLDSKSSTVYFYAGAASRRSGSQNATSSFALNNSNSNGKGIVTDGNSFWVVNDSTSSDKVFKYTLSGTLLGSWTIDASNAHPTGVTIDPNNVSNIWIIDSTALKVFQYNAAASRISGSQSAATSFTLAAGNTNPQDIADPPPAGSVSSSVVVDCDLTTGAAGLIAIDWFASSDSNAIDEGKLEFGNAKVLQSKVPPKTNQRNH